MLISKRSHYSSAATVNQDSAPILSPLMVLTLLKGRIKLSEYDDLLKKAKANLTGVIISTHREPKQLDFPTFFHSVDSMTKEVLLKRQPHITSTVHLYRSDIQTTSTFSIFDTGVKKRISDIIFEIIDQHTHDYYCIVTEGWSPASPSIKIEIEEAGYKHGDMARMPMHKKKEVLIIDGKTNDGKESLSAMYDIIRERPGR